MPTLRRAGEAELEKLRQIFLKAETDIINEIGRLRSMGNVDYHAVAALERVQATLRNMESDSWEYVPQMIEKEFYAAHPEARKIYESIRKHKQGYINADALTTEQIDIVERLTMNLMGEITDATITAMSTLQSALIGRIEPDIYRQIGLEQVAARAATGKGAFAAVPGFVEALRREGVTAFIDKAGRRWSLHTYCSMVSRTTYRQAQTLAALTADPEHDLYRISSHGTTCALCAPYEGRVYSKSGTDPVFPPLADAFGIVDKAGARTLANSWLNIHPNCLHSIAPWSPAGRSQKEIEEIERFSSPRTNPYSRDPRTQKQIEAYHAKEAARRRWLADYRQWENYRMTLGNKVPKTFNTFLKHKRAGDDKYRDWTAAYKEANNE